MEFIRKQSLLSSIIQIAGAVLGGLSTIFIYPNDLRLYGLYGFLTNTASLLVPFISLGFGTVLLRYYPHFNNSEENSSRFFSFIFSAYTLGILVFACLFLMLFPCIQDILSSNDTYIVPFVLFILPIGILYVVFDLFSILFINFKRLALPAFLVFLMKLFLPFLFILSFKDYITDIQFTWLICLYYVFAIGILYYKLSGTSQFKFPLKQFVFRIQQRDAMVRFALFSILGGASAILALRIDSILVTSFIGAKANGLFTLAVFISNVAFIPAAALTDGLNAMVAAHSKEKNQHDLKTVYSKSSVNMLIPTVWIALCIYTGFIYLSQLMPNPDELIKIERLLAWLLLARIVDAATGINHYILAYSKYYVLELYLLVLMAVLNIAFNFWLIPQLGIEGAALATFLSVAIYNILKTLVVYWKTGMQPFSKSWLKLVLLIGFCYVLMSQIHLELSPLWSLAIQSTLTTIVFLGLVYFSKISYDLNQLIQEFSEKALRLISSKRNV